MFQIKRNYKFRKFIVLQQGEMILCRFFFFYRKSVSYGRCVTRENEIPVSINYREDWKKKKPYATDVSVLDRKGGNISPTMVQKWQEGVKLSTRKLMVVRTSYSGMQESVHNKTVDPVTSFSFHCPSLPSYQYPIFSIVYYELPLIFPHLLFILRLAIEKIKILLILIHFFFQCYLFIKTLVISTILYKDRNFRFWGSMCNTLW